MIHLNNLKNVKEIQRLGNNNKINNLITLDNQIIIIIVIIIKECH